MQIKVLGESDGVPVLRVVDPSDGAIVREEAIEPGQQVVVTCTTASSPADLNVVCEAIPEPEAEAAETGDGEQAGEVEQPGGVVEGAEAPEGGESPQGETPTPEDGEGEGGDQGQSAA